MVLYPLKIIQTPQSRRVVSFLPPLAEHWRAGFCGFAIEKMTFSARKFLFSGAFLPVFVRFFILFFGVIL
ncbi:hypothetical protein HW49_10155 [Porphyromonadaceae bacterium COT-184 OH4590]|nr:hypothetical protein HW49_10155 [Porphyromonadaceae bacterium COT-184 OH4590]